MHTQHYHTDRRLAAILSADVVGYSRLMGIDEVGTPGALRAHRAELIDPTILEHNGRIVKLIGATACSSSSQAPSTPCSALSQFSNVWQYATLMCLTSAWSSFVLAAS
jgi:class 3 adenylate cyclase